MLRIRFRIPNSALIMVTMFLVLGCRPKYVCVEKRVPQPEHCEPSEEEGFPEFYQYLGTAPGGYRYEWTDNLQGVTHDEDNWFFTQSEDLWRIPVDQYLVEENLSGEIKVSLTDLGLDSTYNHFGDIDYFEHEGVGYLFAPVTGGDVVPVIIAISNDTLELKAVGVLDHNMRAGWCALRQEGSSTFLFTSTSITSEKPIRKYEVDWDALENDSNFLSDSYSLLRLWDGSEEIEISSMQGGVFSERGNLYLVNGYCKDFDEKKGKIWVFDVGQGEDAYLVDASTNGKNPFNFEWHTDCDTTCTCDEPEGITIWDLDNGRSPCIAGQIHVLMIDNEASRGDRLYFKHYTTSAMDKCKI